MSNDITTPEKIVHDWAIRDYKNLDLAEFSLKILPQYVKTGLLVADVGCGYGRHMVYFHLKGSQTVGIEYDLEYAIKEAQERTKNLGLSLPIIRADARAIPLRSSTFDIVLCMGSALSEKHWLWLTKEDRRKWIMEMTRICKLGGTILVEVGNRYTSLRACAGWIKHYLVAIKSILTGGKVEIGDYYEKELGCWFHDFTIKEIKEMFSDLPVNIQIHKPNKFFFPLFLALAQKKG